MFCRKIVVGDPKDDKSFLGALISKEHLAKVNGYVEIAEKEGATILCGKEELKLPVENKNVGYLITGKDIFYLSYHTVIPVLCHLQMEHGKRVT